jgi:hypothetical protein
MDYRRRSFGIVSDIHSRYFSQVSSTNGGHSIFSTSTTTIKLSNIRGIVNLNLYLESARPSS